MTCRPGRATSRLTLSQLLPLTGAVVVCTPQDVALLDAVKAIAMFRKVNIPVLGMIENMSGFVCPDCQKRYDIFGSGGAQKEAEQLNVPFLGDVPINIQIRVHGDEGTTLNNFNDETVAPYLEKICHRSGRKGWPNQRRKNRQHRRYPCWARRACRDVAEACSEAAARRALGCGRCSTVVSANS